MTRSPTKTTKRASTRSRVPAVKNQDDFDAIQDDAPEDGDVDVDDDSEDSADMLNKFLAEYRKRESKKVSARNAAFQTQKKGLFAAARRTSKDLARDGTAALEEMKAKLLVLKEKEVSAEKFSDEIVPRWHGLERDVKAVLSLHSAGIEDVSARRAKVIDAANQMLRSNPGRRREGLEKCKEDANTQLYQSILDQQRATDAANLIKGYKNILLSI